MATTTKTICEQIAEDLKVQQETVDAKNKDQSKWEKNKLKYEEAKAYWEKIDWVYCSPNDKAISFETITNSLNEMQHEANLFSASLSELLEKKKNQSETSQEEKEQPPTLKECLDDVKKAFDVTEEAIKILTAGESNVKDAAAELAKEDEVFKKSEIMKTLDATFKSLDEIKVKVSETLEAAFIPLKTAFLLEYSVGAGNGLLKHIEEMKKLIPKQPPLPEIDYHTKTKAKWELAKSDKEKDDKDIAKRDAAAVLVKSYQEAKKALGCAN